MGRGADKKLKIRRDFGIRVTSNFDRKYPRNGTRYRQSEKASLTRTLPTYDDKIWQTSIQKGRKIGQRKLRVAITLCGAPYCCHYSVINIDACVHVGGWSMQVFQCVSVRVYCSLIRSILEDAWQNYRQITTGWFARLLSNSVLLRLALSLLFYMDRLV